MTPLVSPSVVPEMLLLALALPLVTAGLVALTGRWPNLRETVSVLGSIATCGVVATTILPLVAANGRPYLLLLEVLPGLDLALRAEPLGVTFALLASGLWGVTALYAAGYLRGKKETNQTRFFVCFAAAIFGALGVALASNLFTLFVFYELITLSTYPLVTHHGNAEAKRAGRVYLGILMSTSIAFLLLGVVWTGQIAGTLEFRDGGILAGKIDPSLVAPLLALFAFGAAKAALMPFHRWLPAAMVAPTPVSALLHAVAVVKAGVFTVVKVVVYVFGLDLLQRTGGAEWLVWVAAFTLLSASLVALGKDNLKARLAYSTISQLAYIVLGAALVTEAALTGAGLHIVMHAFGKITLFFCAGAIYVASGRKNISDMRGLGRRMPWTFAAFFLGSLSVAGIPPLGGSWSKWLLASGAAGAEHTAIVALYMISSLLALAYLMPVVFQAVFLPPRADDTFALAEGRREPLLCVAPPVVTAIACVVLFFAVDPLYRFVTGMLP